MEENLEMKKTGQTLTKEETARLAQITECLADNLGTFLDDLNYVIAKANLHNIPPLIPHNDMHPTIFQEVIVSITATVMAVFRNRNTTQAKTFTFTLIPMIKLDSKSEKLPNISE